MPLPSLLRFYFTLNYTFSDEKPHRANLIMLLTEEPYTYGSGNSLKSKRPSGVDIYINGSKYKHEFKYNRGRNDPVENVAFELIHHLASSDSTKAKVDFNRLAKANAAIYVKGQTFINALKDSITDSFGLAGVDGVGLYSNIELKNASGDSDLDKRIKYIDLNVKQFIKSKRIYAGLAFLHNVIENLRFGFAVSEPSHSEDNPTPRAVIFTSHTCWAYKGIRDEEGDLLNKIIEAITSLLASTPHSEPLVQLYNTLKDYGHVRLKTDVLVRLIDALTKHKELRLPTNAVAQLRILEPQHPVIETAERTIRREKVFSEISKAIHINVSDIQSMGGVEFEEFLENQFKKAAFNVERTKATGDFGADLIVETKSGTRAAVQAKRFKLRTNLKAVQEVVASIPHYAADFGIVIATSGFLPSAIKLAETNSVELWDEDKLIRFLTGDLSFSLLSEGASDASENVEHELEEADANISYCPQCKYTAGPEDFVLERCIVCGYVFG